MGIGLRTFEFYFKFILLLTYEITLRESAMQGFSISQLSG